MSAPTDSAIPTQRWPHLVIRASAGTGKTFRLSNRFLELLAADVTGEQILATTFTRKAAGEILDRVLFRLAEAAHDPKALAQLGQFIAPGELSRDECLALLEQTTRHVHRLRVSTLDSFFMAIAGSFSLELGLPSGWTITDDATDQRLRAMAIEATLSQDATEDLLRLFHLLTKAETTRSISRVVYDTVNGLYGLFLESPPEAWQQLRHCSGLEEHELDALLDELEAFPLTGELATKRDACINDVRAGNWESFIRKGLGSKILAGETTWRKKPIPEAFLALFERLLTHARSTFINPVVGHNEGTFHLLEKFHREYQRLKQRYRLLRFDDVTRLVGSAPQVADTQRLGFRLDGGVRHLLLDEFQDTSLSQWQVLRPLAKEVTDAPAETSFFCVGDVKQAIYGWRGGLAQIFDAVDSELSSLDRQELVESFRSAQPVIDAVNQIFTRLHHHPKLDDHEGVVREWQKRYTPHTTAKTHLPGYTALRVLPNFKEEEDPQGARDQYVAQYVKDLLVASPGRTICVLTRKNEMVRRLVFALRALGVDASEEGGNRLTDSAAVGLILSLLQIADHPGDTVARYHLAMSPLGQQLGLCDHTDHAAATTFSANLRRELISEGLGPMVLRWAKLLAPYCNRREMSRLDQLVEMAYQYAPRSSLRADDFIDFVEQKPLSDPTRAPVRVMTVHQSKGLQFDIVVLPELDATLSGQNDPFVVGRTSPTGPIEAVCRYVEKAKWPFLPKRFQQMFHDANQQKWAEALCVLYVAVTRPIHALHMLIGAEEGICGDPHKTFAGLLRAALCEGRVLTPDAVAFETGDCDWAMQTGAAPAEEVAAAAASPALFRIQLATGARERGWQSISPSQLEGGPALRITDVVRPARSAGQDFGTLVHAWLAHIEWLENGLPSDDELKRAAIEEVGWQTDVSEPLRQFKAWLTNSKLRELLSQKALREDAFCKFDQLEVSNERRFALKQDGQLMNGSIDRLVLYLCDGQVVAADILDYKTDGIARDDTQALADKVEFYRPQIAAYVQAVQRMYDLPAGRVRARLLFLSLDEIVTTEEPTNHEVHSRRGHSHRQPTQRPLF